MCNWNAPPIINHIDDDEVHIWATDLSVSSLRIKQYSALLSAEEKERSNRFIHSTHRKRFIAAHGFLRNALASYLHQSPAELIFLNQKKGKPELVSKHENEHLNFNLSHSNDLAILAVCKNKAVGIDVEYMNRKNEWKTIVKRFFADEEQVALFSLPEKKQQQAFYQVWTRKEAHMKVTGEGMHLAPSQFTVSVPPQAAEFIRYTEMASMQQWQMHDIDFQDMFTDYCGCISVEGRGAKISQFVFHK